MVIYFYIIQNTIGLQENVSLCPFNLFGVQHIFPCKLLYKKKIKNINNINKPGCSADNFMKKLLNWINVKNIFIVPELYSQSRCQVITIAHNGRSRIIKIGQLVLNKNKTQQ